MAGVFVLLFYSYGGGSHAVCIGQRNSLIMIQPQSENADIPETTKNGGEMVKWLRENKFTGSGVST